jgi:hypothetical protein
VRRWLKLVRTALAILIAGATSCSRPAESNEELSFSTFDCWGPIDAVEAPPDDWSIVLDVIAFPENSPLQRGRFDDEIGRHFSKFGLVIRSGSPLQLRIGDTSYPNAVMGWGVGSSEPVGAIDIEGCQASRSEDWVVYAGGVWTVDPACVEIEVSTSNETLSVDLPIGIACD